MRRNIDLTYIVMDNQIYGLTKGQLSPTSRHGLRTVTSPEGSLEDPVNPLLYVLGYGAHFVAQSTPGDMMGLTAGIDLTLALVEADHGHGVAMAVAKRLVLFLRRSGNQAQFSSALQRQEAQPPKLRDISAFVLEHVDEALPVDRVAAAIGMSPRTLSRWCREHLDESPAEFVRRLRLEEARRLLEETSLPLKEVTARTGFGDGSTLWRAFTQRLGVTPAAYRQRFTSAPSRAAG